MFGSVPTIMSQENSLRRGSSAHWSILASTKNDTFVGVAALCTTRLRAPQCVAGKVDAAAVVGLGLEHAGLCSSACGVLTGWRARANVVSARRPRTPPHATPPHAADWPHATPPHAADWPHATPPHAADWPHATPAHAAARDARARRRTRRPRTPPHATPAHAAARDARARRRAQGGQRCAYIKK